MAILLSSVNGLALNMDQDLFDYPDNPSIKNRGFENWYSTYDIQDWYKTDSSDTFFRTSYERSGSYGLRLTGTQEVVAAQNLAANVYNAIKGHSMSFGFWFQAYSSSTGADDVAHAEISYFYGTYTNSCVGGNTGTETGSNWAFVEVSCYIPSSTIAVTVKIVVTDPNGNSISSTVDDARVTNTEKYTSTKSYGKASLDTRIHSIQETYSGSSYNIMQLSTSFALNTYGLSTSILYLQVEITLYPQYDKCKKKILGICVDTEKYTDAGDVNIYDIPYGNNYGQTFNPYDDYIQDQAAATAGSALGSAAGMIAGIISAPTGTSFVVGTATTYLVTALMSNPNSYDTDANGGFDLNTDVKHNYDPSPTTSYPSRIAVGFLGNDYSWTYRDGDRGYYIKIVGKGAVGHYEWKCQSGSSCPSAYYRWYSVVDETFSLTQYVYV